jgi:hypothetical protein
MLRAFLVKRTRPSKISIHLVEILSRGGGHLSRDLVWISEMFSEGIDD